MRWAALLVLAAVFVAGLWWITAGGHPLLTFLAVVGPCALAAVVWEWGSSGDREETER